ncbi:MAG: OmpA family protein [Desulfurivibrio sp.]|nr:OmpA family protein [Desulfurivibrio sp.]
MKLWRGLLLLTAALLMLGACAPKAHTPYTPVTPQDLSDKVADGEYEARVDNFVLLLDASSSMARPYTTGTRFQTAVGLGEALNETLPELSWQAGLRYFGPRFTLADNEQEGALAAADRSVRLYGLAPHSRERIARGLEQVAKPSGTTPLADALVASGEDLADQDGKSALVVFTDGEADPAAVQEAVAGLRERFGEQLCIYPVMVGDDPAGQALLEEVVARADCGFVTQADQLLAGEALADFAIRAFLQEVEDPPVAEESAKEPVAEKPAEEPAKDEPAYRTEARRLEVNFAFDSAALRPVDHAALDRFAEFLKNHPELKRVTIAGHTCNMGPAAYNLKLSQRRAESVVDFLVQRQDIAARRLVAKGYGEEKPLVANDTLAARQQNRRVEAEVRVVVKDQDQ